jgi:H-type small acid-soluble spore protein
MDFQRAQEIINSPGYIEILHEGRPIWIDALHTQENTAEIRENKSSKETKIVPVNELIEA